MRIEDPAALLRRLEYLETDLRPYRFKAWPLSDAPISPGLLFDLVSEVKAVIKHLKEGQKS